MKMYQKGVGLIEMVLVIAIIAGIIIGGVGYYRSNVAAQRASDLTSGIHGIQASTRAMANGTGSYGVGSLNAILVRNDRVPATFKPSGATITTPFGSAVTVTGATSSFTITVASAGTSECTTLLTSSGNFVSYKVGAAAAVTTVPADMITADTACAAAADVVLTSL